MSFIKTVSVFEEVNTLGYQFVGARAYYSIFKKRLSNTLGIQKTQPPGIESK